MDVPNFGKIRLIAESELFVRVCEKTRLKALAANVSVEYLLEDYPELELEDIRVCILYTAELVEQDRVYPINRS